MELLQGRMSVFMVYSLLPETHAGTLCPIFCCYSRPIFGQSLFFDGSLAFSHRPIEHDPRKDRASDQPVQWTLTWIDSHVVHQTGKVEG